MKLYHPFIIAPNLEPGLEIGGAYITLQYGSRPHPERRQRYEWTWFMGDKEESGDDLASGVGGGTLQQGFESMLSFLSAFASATEPDDENHDLFPQPMREWAEQNSDELEIAWLELNERRDEQLIEE